MAECIILKGGGGADLAVVTAESSDVLAGKVFVDKNGEPSPGTLALSGDVSNDQVLAGRSYYSTDPKNKQIGSMPNYSSTPTAIDAIRINNNRFEVAVARGFHGYNWAGGGYEYMSYDQVANAIGLTPDKLKRGEWVCGRTGTFEGYVPTASDLYVRGNNLAGFEAVNVTRFDAGQITIPTGGTTGMVTKLRSILNFVGYNWLNIEGVNTGTNLGKFILAYRDSGGYSVTIGEVANIAPGPFTISFNVSAAQLTSTTEIMTGTFIGAIYRIWKS